MRQRLPVYLPTQAVGVEDSFAKQLTEAGIIKSTLFKGMNLLVTNGKSIPHSYRSWYEGSVSRSEDRQ